MNSGELDVEPKKNVAQEKQAGTEAAVCGQEPWHRDQNKEEE
jgi:hypothetical protein